MPEESFRIPDYVNEKIHSFLDIAKANEVLDSGIFFLMCLYTNDISKFKLINEDILDFLCKNTNSLGLTSNDIIVSDDIKQNLRSFFQDKKNLSILKQDNYAKNIIEFYSEEFENYVDKSKDSTSLNYFESSLKIREIAELAKQFIYNEDTISPAAIKALASIEIKGEIIDSIFPELERPKLPELKRKAIEIGITEKDGKATPQTRDALNFYFSERNLGHQTKFIREFYSEVKNKLSPNKLILGHSMG